MKLPFEADFTEILAAPERFVDAVFSSLASEFLVLPKGEGFVEYPDFEAGYEALKRTTDGFASLSRQKLVELVSSTPICFIVLRTMLGFTPPEWAYVTTQRKGVTVLQGFARTLDRRIRMEPLRPLRTQGEVKARVAAMIETACELLEEVARLFPSGASIGSRRPTPLADWLPCATWRAWACPTRCFCTSDFSDDLSLGIVIL